MRIRFMRVFVVVSIILNLLVSQLSVFFAAPALASFSSFSEADIVNTSSTSNASVSDDWMTQIKEQIKNEEYLPTLQTQDAQGRQLPTETWHFVNRVNNLRSYIRADSWTLQPRTIDADNQWTWESQFASWGRAGSLSGSGSPQDKINADKKIVNIERNGLTEWYQNNEKGIKQNFTLTQKPEGTGEVVIRSSVRTSLALQSSNTQIAFIDTYGLPRLTLDNLLVFDVLKNQIPARFEVNQAADNYQLDIVIDDTNAIYPLTIDPLAAAAAWTAESDQIGARLGYSVSTAGDVNGDGYSDVIVGAYTYDNGESNEGAAFVYHGSAAGLSAAANWTIDSNQTDALFGYSVSTAGDVNGDGYSDVIVGAYSYDNDQINDGCAYVYYGSASGLSTSADWIVEGDQEGSNYGYSVATAGDVNADGYSDVIISAYYYSNGQNFEGRAYVYHGSAVGLSTVAAWIAESDQAAAQFGFSVASAGDVNGDGYSDVIIGADAYDNGESNEGRAYVYHGSAAGLSTSAAWTAESNQASAFFGTSVAAAGDVNGDGYTDVVVGANAYDNGESNEGQAFVFYGSAIGLSTTADWTYDSDQEDAELGLSVASAGDVNGDGYADLIVGDYFYTNIELHEGRAFVFYGSSTGLSTTADWTAEPDQATAQFGISVSAAGDVNGDGYSDVIIGASTYDNGQADEGRAYVYYGSAPTLSTTAAWVGESDQATAQFGISVSAAGDVNGDGFGDVIVGAERYDNGQSDEGRAFVFHGSALGLSAVADWTAESNQATSYFGFAVSTVGDVNSDGYSDVAVGAYNYDNDEANEGRVYVYYGSAAGLSTNADWTAESNVADAAFGDAISTAGDVNGDGYSDILIGSSWYSTGSGRVYVYHGSATGLSTTSSWTGSSESGGRFGISVSDAGDVNADGFSDVIVGAGTASNGEINEGQAFVYHGSASGLSSSANWTGQSNQESAYYGISVSGAGDVNGDGYTDVIVGSERYDNGENDEGQVFVYYGSASGVSAVADWTADSDIASAYFGSSVSRAGDVNGDGYSDVLIGADLYTNGQNFEGAAFVYHGSASGLSATPNWTTEANQVNASYGNFVSTAGDVNGDGYSDVIVGSYFYDNGQSDEGRAYVYYGNNGGGLTVVPRQLNSTLRQIQLGNKSDFNVLYLSLLSRTPMGRTKVKLWWEIAQFGVNFTMSSLGKNSTWTDSTLSAVETLSTKLLLLNSYPYHWRVRLQYLPSMNFTPWFSIGGNGWNEKDVLTADTPIYPAPPNPGPGNGCTNEVPKAPLLYSSERVDANSIRLFFSDPGGTYDRIAVEYGVERGKYIYAADNIGPKGTRTYVVSQLHSNQIYFFRVRAGNGCMPGVWSSELKSDVLVLPKFTLTATGSAQISLVQPTLSPSSSEQPVLTIPSSTPNPLEITRGKIIKIKVLNQHGGPIAFAKVTLFSEPRVAYTDSQGQAEFSGIESGDHRLVIEKDGYTGEQKVSFSNEVQIIELTVKIELTKKYEAVYFLVGFALCLGVSLLFGLIILIKKRREKKQ